MSFELGGKVLEDKSITDVRLFCVMLCLADATNKETGTCYPSHKRIAEVARCDRSTAIRALNTLEKKGWIEVIRRTDPKGCKLASVYKIIKYQTPGVIAPLPPGVMEKQDSRVVTPPPSVTVEHKPIREEPIKEPKKAKLDKFSKESVVLPLFLQTPEFSKAWNDFIKDRRARKKPMTDGSQERILEICLGWGVEKSISAINASIRSGWSDIYEPKGFASDATGENNRPGDVLRNL